MSCTLRPLRHVIIYCNVGWCVKGSAVYRSRQQSFVAEWLGLSFTVRVMVRARARECGFFRSFFFFLCVVCHSTYGPIINGRLLADHTIYTRRVHSGDRFR